MHTTADTAAQVYAGLLHTHLLGKRWLRGCDRSAVDGNFVAGVKARVRHVRGGVEQRPMLEDNYYDFDYQNIIRLPRPVTILPVRRHTGHGSFMLHNYFMISSL